MDEPTPDEREQMEAAMREFCETLERGSRVLTALGIALGTVNDSGSTAP